jgi:hypothetical protein
MPARNSAMLNVGHSQTNPNGPAGGSGRAHHRETKECGRRWNGMRQGIRLSSRARATASVRLAAPSLPRTWPTCFLTVSRVTTSSRAMA